MAEEQTTTRNYKDLFSFKEMTLNTLIPKYFPDEEPSTLNVGMIGLTSEQIGITTEDAFNTESVLAKEVFPNKATLPESIYAHAGIFQLNAFQGEAAACKFLLVFDENQLNEIFNQYSSNKDDGHCIYIDKDTKLFVEGLQFTLDYDIELTRTTTKLNSDEYVFGAKYVVNEYDNSISNITTPYIKIRRTYNEYLALEVIAHQCNREISEHTIVDNTLVNYPIIDIEFDDTLAGFDVFYKTQDEDSYTQIATKVLNSLPIKDPFCYYSMKDTGVLRISFSTADSYFQPEFNSKIKVIIYTCKGKNGNFDYYTGNQISVICTTEKYPYNENIILAAKPVTDASNGKDARTLEELQRLTVESFTTSNALVTDNDLEVYFNNYELRFNNEIRFIKRRDDQAYRLYTGYVIMRNDDYVYPTNTLDISLNYLDLYNPDGGYLYTLDPGCLFKYESNTNNRVTPIFKDGVYNEKVYKNEETHITYNQYLYKEYFKWLKDYNVDLLTPDDTSALSKIDIEDKSTWVPMKKPDLTFRHFLNNNLYKCPKCGFTCRKDDKHITYQEVDNTDYTQEITDEMYGNNTWLSFDSELKHATYVGENLNTPQKYVSDGTPYNPLDDMKELINLPVCPVCNHIGLSEGLTLRDFMVTVFDTEDIENIESSYEKNMDSRNKFLFANPFLLSVTKHPGLVTQYSTIISQDSLVDFINYNLHAPFQFILNQVHVRRPLNKDKEYTVSATILPSVSWDSEALIPGISTGTYVGKRTKLGNNYVRMFMVIEDNGVDVCWVEMVPTGLNDSEQIVFETKFKTCDHVTNGNKMQISDYTIEELGYNPKKPSEDDNSSSKGNFVYITNKKDHLIPMASVNVKIVILTKEFNVEDSEQTTNNYPSEPLKFGLEGYQWSNIYDTSTDLIDFIRPLNMVRSSIYFRDDRLNTVDTGDCYLYSVPFVKHSLMTHYDSDGNLLENETGYTNFEMFTYFFDKFLLQYDHMSEILDTTIRNASHVDMKFYNTYGRSKNYLIGDSDEVIDRVNISICFYVYLLNGTDFIKAKDEIKSFIKKEIEKINEFGSNDLNISNLMRKIEVNFAYVDHLKFAGFNGKVKNGEYITKEYDSDNRLITYGYSTDYQTIKNVTDDLDELSKDDRFAYVPEMLCVNKDQISLVLFEV